MGVTDTIQATAGNVAGAGAAILLSAKESAEGLLRAGWTAPPLKIPAGLINKKEHGQNIEIPPAMLMMAVGAFLAYGFLRAKGIKPFDWLWDSVNSAATYDRIAKLTRGNDGMTDSERKIVRAALAVEGHPTPDTTGWSSIMIAAYEYAETLRLAAEQPSGDTTVVDAGAPYELVNTMAGIEVQHYPNFATSKAAWDEGASYLAMWKANGIADGYIVKDKAGNIVKSRNVP